MAAADINSGGPPPFAPRAFMAALARHRGTAFSSGQQDAYELYHTVVDALSAEIVAGVSARHARIPAAHRTLRLDDNAGLERLVGRARDGRGVPSAPFWPRLLPVEGLLGSRIACDACGYRSSLRLSPFESISLAMPPVPQGASVPLTNLVRDHFRLERIADYTCPRCSLLATRKHLRLRLRTAAATAAATATSSTSVGPPADDRDPAAAAAPAANPSHDVAAAAAALAWVQRALDSGDYDAIETTEHTAFLQRKQSLLVAKQLALCRVRRAGGGGPCAEW